MQRRKSRVKEKKKEEKEKEKEKEVVVVNRTLKEEWLREATDQSQLRMLREKRKLPPRFREPTQCQGQGCFIAMETFLVNFFFLHDAMRQKHERASYPSSPADKEVLWLSKRWPCVTRVYPQHWFLLQETRVYIHYNV